MLKLCELTYMLRITSKAKIYKKPLYEGIPQYHKPHYVDIHDGYTYRSKEEVLNELRGLNLKMKVTRHVYPEDDPESFIKNRKVKTILCRQS
jgi:hypothetical protein